ncbi:DUF5919 domain-containing protein [Lentzea cavernae]|uniref:DUF5919 domain-containing protein n=1 Tax=Lentzea cavernae TaxID=2020703 RepID=A0ABQ3MWK9_9PSEU|nr:DUF5919 domain-containing protein [Lentzea cavernae]GHH61109.1 hypothetical protein GCM10017774_86550 [Lentzea cavernae]
MEAFRTSGASTPTSTSAIIDQLKCLVQPYLPDARGVESPTLVIEKDETMPGLYTTFAQVFDSMWDRAREVA